MSIYSVNPVSPANKNLLVGLWINARNDKIILNGGDSSNLITLIGSNLSETPGDIQSQFSGNFSAGLPTFPSETSLGEGSSYISGMVVFVYNALTNTSVDYTNIASVDDMTTFNAFTTPMTTNNALYIGGDLFYYGIKLNLSTVIVILSGLISSALIWEYWNGSSWTPINFMVTLANSPYTIQNMNSFGVGTVISGHTNYQYRFGNLTGWSTTLKTGAGIVLPPSPFTDTVTLSVAGLG